jgi:hypothetical protein
VGGDKLVLNLGERAVNLDLLLPGTELVVDGGLTVNCV